MKSNRKTINLQRKNRRATFDIHRQPQVNTTIYLLLVDNNAQCQQTWPTSTIGYQHTATIGNQKHNTPQSKTANKCRKGTTEGTKWRAYLYPKPQQRSNRLTSDTDDRRRQQRRTAAYDGTARATRNHARTNRRTPYWGHALGTVDFGTYGSK